MDGHRPKSRQLLDIEFLPGITIAFVLGVVLLIACRIALFPVKPQLQFEVTDNASLEQAATATAQAMQLNQSAQWAISTVLTLGAALIGLNFYSSRMTREEDKQRFTQLKEELQNEILNLINSHSQAEKDLVLQLENSQAGLVRLARAQFEQRVPTIIRTSIHVQDHIVALHSFMNTLMDCSLVPQRDMQTELAVRRFLVAYELYVQGSHPLEVEKAYYDVSIDIIQACGQVDRDLARDWLKFHSILTPREPTAVIGEIGSEYSEQ